MLVENGWERVICIFNKTGFKMTSKYKLKYSKRSMEDGRIWWISLELHLPPIGIIRYGYTRLLED
jgi:hypothetical protein